MAAHLTAGKIAGIPVVGGHVSLEQADANQIINATRGLVSEVTDTALTIGAFGLGAMILAGILSSKSEREKERERDLKKNPLLSLGGICQVKLSDREYVGICLNDEIDFVGGGGRYTANINHVNGLHCKYGGYPEGEQTEKSRSLWAGIVGTFLGDWVVPDVVWHYPASPPQYNIRLIDGSRFKDVCVANPLRFATIVGIDEIGYSEKDAKINGVSQRDLQRFRNILIKNLHGIRPKMIKNIGPEIVSRYFHIAA